MRLANSHEPITKGMVAAMAPAQISGPTCTGPGTYLVTASSADALWQHTADTHVNRHEDKHDTWS